MIRSLPFLRWSVPTVVVAGSILVLATSLVTSAAEPPSEPAAEPATQRFRFVYDATVTQVAPGKTVDVWTPLAAAGPHQNVEIESIQTPGTRRRTVERRFGNPLLFVRAEADAQGRVPIVVTYRVTRREVRPEDYAAVTDAERTLFREADALVPVGGKPLQTLTGTTRPTGSATEIGRLLFDRVGDHVEYKKPAGGDWGRGDAVWVCDSKHGNCTDFHSLFIAACRGLDLPAKFEIGFTVPAEPASGAIAGYHCWAFFAADGKWAPVDISEADKNPERRATWFGRMPPDRVSFTTGRDLQLDPPPKSGPANFLIDPFVEVDGRRHLPRELRHRYEALPTKD